MKKALLVILIAGLLTACSGKATTPTENKDKAPTVEVKGE